MKAHIHQKDGSEIDAEDICADKVISTRSLMLAAGLSGGCRVRRIRRDLHGHELRPTLGDKVTRPDLPTPPGQQCSRNLVAPSRRSALPVAPEALLDDPDLLGIRPFPPPTFVDKGENLNL